MTDPRMDAQALPILSDAALRKRINEFRSRLSQLQDSSRQEDLAWREHATRLLPTLEAELAARGLEGAPWWSAPMPLRAARSRADARSTDRSGRPVAERGDRPSQEPSASAI